MKLPCGISNYEKLVEGNNIYIDKTKYIKKLEDLQDSYIMYLRPRKFGKTLFTSVLENYYDILKANKFETLFSNTYIGKKPTENKNKYHVLRFNFSGIDTTSIESTIDGFKYATITKIKKFIEKYKIDFYVDEKQEAETILRDLFVAFSIQKANEKIYVIIDEYDHFANELLGFDTANFKNLVTKNGKVRKWYEILKEGTESVVDRIFITGVAPITLDGLTSGFNISKDISRNPLFNQMMGFTEEEIKGIMETQKIDKQTQEELLPIMKENYDGYRFSEDEEEMLEDVYNSNMCLYFLNEYTTFNKIPTKIIDMNIASDYSKLSKMLDTCKTDKKIDIITKSLTGEPIVGKIVQGFNPEIGFGENELISMLFYMGYLTIIGERLGRTQLQIPNKVMKDLYGEYFLEILEKDAKIKIENSEYTEILDEMAEKGKINKLSNTAHEILKRLSNRDYINFDEKYVKLIYYTVLASPNFEIYRVKSEHETEKKYTDLLIMPTYRGMGKGYYSILIEFKYIKKGDYQKDKNKLKEKQEEAKKQVLEYAEHKDVKDIPDLKVYTVVAIGEELYIESIEK